jgi:hypothetical protein
MTQKKHQEASQAELAQAKAEAATLRIEKYEEPGKLKTVTGCHDDKLSLAAVFQKFER